MSFFFYFLLSVLALFSYYTIIISNVINSLLSLICCFIRVTGLLLLFDFSFFSLILVTIYLGAVAILFLFILMLLNIPIVFLRLTSTDFFFFFLFLLFAIGCFYSLHFFSIILDENTLPNFLIFDFVDYTDSLLLLGLMLYVYGKVFFLLLGFLLFVTLIAILFLLFQESP